MVKEEIVCNCGNKITYESDAVEEKTLTCACGKKIKVLNHSNKFEVHFEV